MFSVATPNFSIPGSTSKVRLYWIATGLFTLLFSVSVILTLGEFPISVEVYRVLGFDRWLVFFNAFAKILGLAAILQNRSRTLKEFAFAGFLFDLLLALVAHILLQQIEVFLALFGLVLWTFAFVMHRRVYPINDRLEASPG